MVLFYYCITQILDWYGNVKGNNSFTFSNKITVLHTKHSRALRLLQQNHCAVHKTLKGTTPATTKSLCCTQNTQEHYACYNKITVLYTKHSRALRLLQQNLL